MLRRYRIECELAAPSAGALYFGCDTQTGSSVAIKLTPLAEPEALDVCLSAKARPQLAGLEHSCIAAIHASVAVGRLHYAVLEKVEGADLRAHILPSNRLPLATVLSIAARVGEALHHAHLHGIVHGDVKPGNIVFDAVTETVKLVDFVSPCASGEENSGTPAYMSPERLRGEPASPAADQFALGVTLYELACGCRPFAAASWPQIAHRVAYDSPTPIQVHDPALPHVLAAILYKALAKEPGARYRSAGTFAADIAALRAQLPQRPACAI